MPNSSYVASKSRVCARLRAARRALKLNQAEAARKASAGAPKWNNWEKERDRPDIDSIIPFCETTSITLDWIFRGRLEGIDPNLRTDLYNFYNEEMRILEKPADKIKRKKAG